MIFILLLLISLEKYQKNVVLYFFINIIICIKICHLYHLRIIYLLISLLNCDIKIDDRLDNLQNAKIKLLFTAYHNKGLDDEYLHSLGVIRVNNWLEIKKILARELNDESGSAAQ